MFTDFYDALLACPPIECTDCASQTHKAEATPSTLLACFACADCEIANTQNDTCRLAHKQEVQFMKSAAAYSAAPYGFPRKNKTFFLRAVYPPLKSLLPRCKNDRYRGETLQAILYEYIYIYVYGIPHDPKHKGENTEVQCSTVNPRGSRRP